MKLPAAAVLAAALSCGGVAWAEDPVKPDLGAGPHRNSGPGAGGAGDAVRPGQPEPKLPAPAKAGEDGAKPAGDGASSGSSMQDEDERRATESKEKAKKRPGYKDEAPSPRAAAPAGRAN